jgi:hypothetical protein
MNSLPQASLVISVGTLTGPGTMLVTVEFWREGKRWFRHIEREPKSEPREVIDQPLETLDWLLDELVNNVPWDDELEMFMESETDQAPVS